MVNSCLIPSNNLGTFASQLDGFDRSWCGGVTHLSVIIVGDGDTPVIRDVLLFAELQADYRIKCG